MADDLRGGITISALTHDLVRKRSIVTLVWDSDPEKRVALPVPFKCSLDDLGAEAERAVRDLSAELGVTEVRQAR